MTRDRCIKALGLWRVVGLPSWPWPSFPRGLQPSAPEDAQLGRGHTKGYLGTGYSLLLGCPPSTTSISWALSWVIVIRIVSEEAACTEKVQPAQLWVVGPQHTPIILAQTLSHFLNNFCRWIISSPIFYQTVLLKANITLSLKWVFSLILGVDSCQSEKPD